MTVKERITALREVMAEKKIDAYLVPTDDFHASASSALTVLPSKPRHIPSPNFSSRNWCTVGTSGSPILKSSTPVPSSCAAAWMKYLPSVHNPAISCMMTALPADPVKPVIYFHASEYVGEYFKCRKYITGFTGSAGRAVKYKGGYF